jgi:hypothetical protein
MCRKRKQTIGLVDDLRAAQAVCSAGRAAELSDSHAPLRVQYASGQCDTKLEFLNVRALVI